MRIVFMGTPEFAVPSLERMLDAGYSLVAAFTQPDRPAGRGKALKESPVKRLSVERGVPVYQFERIRKQEGLDSLRALKPDLIVTAAFGQILNQKILDIPRLGVVNVHASLLPKHRGAAPIQWSIIEGDLETGVTTMYTDIGIDTGDMILHEATPIGLDETAGELTARLAQIGGGLLVKTLQLIERGDAPRIKQDDSKASYDKPILKEDGWIDFAKDADSVANLVRGMNPWPGAYGLIDGQPLKLWSATAAPCSDGAEPGTVLVSGAKEGLFIRCGTGMIEVLELQAPNAKRMAAKAYLAGKQIPVGLVITGKGRSEIDA